MKTEKLMIGDWVKFHLNVFLTDSDGVETEADNILEIGKVSALNDIGNVWVTDSEGQEYELTEYEIEPILLTPEILEKSGINSPNKHKCIFEFFISKDDLIRLIHIGEGWTIDTKVYAKGVNIAYGYFKYVHELQHALRLCGIEKGIKL